jgi:hypothetical protein
MTVISRPLVAQTWHRVSGFLTPNKLYISALVCSLVGILLVFSHRIPSALFIVSFGLCGVGYFFKLMDQLRNKWGITLEKARKVAFSILFNAVVYLASTLFARVAVARALELPVKDFGTTVQVISIVFFPLVWLLFAIVFFLLAMLLSGVFLLFHVGSLQVVSPAVRLSPLFEAQSEKWKDKEKKSTKKAMVLIGDVAGAFGIAYFLLSAAGGYLGMLNRHGGAIRRVAYRFDYQSAERYPNIDHTQRVCFHDNGVISYASLAQDGQVVIAVKNIADK